MHALSSEQSVACLGLSVVVVSKAKGVTMTAYRHGIRTVSTHSVCCIAASSLTTPSTSGDLGAKCATISHRYQHWQIQGTILANLCQHADCGCQLFCKLQEVIQKHLLHSGPESGSGCRKRRTSLQAQVYWCLSGISFANVVT